MAGPPARRQRARVLPNMASRTQCSISSERCYTIHTYQGTHSDRRTTRRGAKRPTTCTNTLKRAAATPLAHTRRAAGPPARVAAARAHTTNARDAYDGARGAESAPPEEAEPEPGRPRSRRPRSRRTWAAHAGHTARHQQQASPRTPGGDGGGGFEWACAHPSRAGRFSPSHEEPPHLRLAREGTRRGVSSRHRHGRQEATALAGSSGQCRTRRGRGASPGRGAARRAAHAALLRTTGKAACGRSGRLLRRQRRRVRAGTLGTRRGRAPVLWVAVGVRRQGFEHARLCGARRANGVASASGIAADARRRRWRRFEGQRRTRRERAVGGHALRAAGARGPRWRASAGRGSPRARAPSF